MFRPFEKTDAISSLWVFVLLNIVFRDLHEFVMPEFLAEVATGEVNGVKITENLMIFGYIVVEIPLAMIIASKFLNFRLVKWLNIPVSVITIAVIASALPGDPDDMLFAATEIAALIGVAVIAWQLPTNERA